MMLPRYARLARHAEPGTAVHALSRIELWLVILTFAVVAELAVLCYGVACLLRIMLALGLR
ncbi:MAG TPA: hypothetical protein VFQ44_02060 [Streptosporangiaceae bacterium]|nr:hypothetical protein [Streptosporangiaceae bacterium]